MNTLDRIIKTSIYVLVFLLPVFFLPFSSEAFEFNKQYLLFFLVSLAFFAWIAKIVFVDKEIRFRRTPLDLFILGFLLVIILSAVFSVDKDSSIFGFYGRFANGLIGFLSLGMLYFLITNNVGLGREKGENEYETKAKPISIRGVVKTLLWSSGAVVLMAYFSIFGVWAKIAGLLSLPRVMLQTTFNPVSGSLEGLSVFLAVIMVLLVGQMLSEKLKARSEKLLYWLLFIASLVLLLIIDFTAAWLIILISLFLFVGFSLWKRIFRENVNLLLIPIFLIVIAAVAMPFQPSKMIFGEGSTAFNLPKEQVLNQRTSWGISLKSATEDVKSGFLGSGVGTFHYDFAKQKPVEINQTWLWQIRFDRAGSHLAELLATTGFLGILSYLTLIGVFLLISWLLLMANGSKFAMPLLLLVLALLIGQFVYYQNITLAFAFWLALGLLAVAWQRPIKEKVVSFKDFPELSLIFSTLVVVLAVVILTSYFFAAKNYLADMNFSKALFILGDERVQTLEKAVRLNPYSPRYRTTLARTYLYEALTEATKPLEEQDSLKIQTMVGKTIDEAKQATFLQPNQVANWETLGIIYREIKGVVSGAADWGVKSFERAIKLEPTNPVLYTELGKLYLAIDDAVKARESFEKAIEKKSDYVDGLIQLTLLLEREDILDEAVDKLEKAAKNNPFNVEILFQLGRLYLNNNQVDKAIEQFKRVVILVPNHSNAHYSLGVAYIIKQEKQLAIAEFLKVLELNPGNQDVVEKLNQLR